MLEASQRHGKNSTAWYLPSSAAEAPAQCCFPFPSWCLRTPRCPGRGKVCSLTRGVAGSAPARPSSPRDSAYTLVVLALVS